MSIEKWMDKEVVYINNGMLFIHKKKWNPAICNMEGPWQCYAKWNKSDEGRQIPYNHIHMQNLKNKTNEQTKQKQTQRFKEQAGGPQRGEGGWLVEIAKGD